MSTGSKTGAEKGSASVAPTKAVAVRAARQALNLMPKHPDERWNFKSAVAKSLSNIKIQPHTKIAI
jgi:hypothetical protein